MSNKLRIEQLELENNKLLFEQRELKDQIVELKLVLDAIDEYQVLKDFKGDLVAKANSLRYSVRSDIVALKNDIFGS